jgi:hypothetical protein
MTKVQRRRTKRRDHHERSDDTKHHGADDKEPSWDSGSRHKALTLELGGGEAVRLDEWLGVLRRTLQREPTMQFECCLYAANSDPNDEREHHAAPALRKQKGNQKAKN